ncbi:SDR family NAD(P)-dependent oxidoreductase [Antrihabitans stalactiti]|uniref:SDR family NAD(P)-dependent oxidoreductase n=1 Tax=Antrihabitans stalactiti TaxID=2584121 RepID=A0A848KFN4_9NOCA|nr:SDR family NAD(P)-dependent oxidoreductase [Antrihabitans stalactiti]NMN95512.1 SDR family NAD(P)-dependent oxidoreductase [Antrihabitans stalactiti]
MKINRLQPKLVVVTGAGSGIGRAISLRFAKLGAHVVVSDIDLRTADETVALIEANGDRASSALLDVTDPDAWERVAADIRAKFGVADVLVNNAGLVVAGAFLDTTPQSWDRQLGPNLMGVVYGSLVFGRQMAELGRGHIVNIASAASYTPVPGTSAYNVSKAGVRMLTDCLRVELGPKGVSATSICPGLINTNLGNHAETVGIDANLFQDGVGILDRVRDFVDTLPISPLSPDLVARAAVRGVRFDLDVVPVRTEAWLTYAMYRIAPSVTRGILRQFPVERLEAAGVRLMSVLDRVSA